MSLADKLANKQNPPAVIPPNPADIKKTEDAIEAKEAHILALEQGLRVFRKERLNMVILKDGTKVKPTPEGFFIGLNTEIEEHLEYHATKQYGQVEEFAVEKKQ